MPKKSLAESSGPFSSLQVPGRFDSRFAHIDDIAQTSQALIRPSVDKLYNNVIIASVFRVLRDVVCNVIGDHSERFNALTLLYHIQQSHEFAIVQLQHTS